MSDEKSRPARPLIPITAPTQSAGPDPDLSSGSTTSRRGAVAGTDSSLLSSAAAANATDHTEDDEWFTGGRAHEKATTDATRTRQRSRRTPALRSATQAADSTTSQGIPTPNRAWRRK